MQPVSPREIVCSGTQSDMGAAQGHARREEIHSAIQALNELEAFRLKQPRWMPYSVYRSIAGRKARRALQRPLTEQLPAARQRLEGIANSAGIRLEDAYLLNALEPLLSDVQEQTVAVPIGACSAVAVRGRRSAIDEPIIARNFDYLPLVQPFYIVRKSCPDVGARSLDFTVAPLCGTVDGINQHGLAITFDYAFATDAAVPAAPISMVIADTLQHCRSVSEAAERIASRQHWGAGMLMMADAAGDIASLKLSNTRCHLVRPAEDDDIVYHSNAFGCDEMQDVEVSRDATYTDSAPKPLCGRRVLESSERRDARFAELITDHQQLGPDELATLMADHGADGEPGPDSICMHSDYWNTTACLQIFPRSRRMRVAFDTACRAEYSEFQL